MPHPSGLCPHWLLDTCLGSPSVSWQDHLELDLFQALGFSLVEPMLARIRKPEAENYCLLV